MTSEVYLLVYNSYPMFTPNHVCLSVYNIYLLLRLQAFGQRSSFYSLTVFSLLSAQQKNPRDLSAQLGFLTEG